MLKRLILSAIRFYQAAVSPRLPSTCRYVPSCSEYAREAIVRLGAARGSWMTVRRLLRCHPLGGRGYDPVPPGGSAEGGARGNENGGGAGDQEVDRRPRTGA